MAESIERAKSKDEPDPMPHVDAFDVMVELSNAIPMTVTHDIEELDVDHSHVRVNGIGPATADAQNLATKMAEVRCVSGAKIAKVSQVVGDTRQKYVLEFELKCPEDTGGVKKKPKAADAANEDKP